MRFRRLSVLVVLLLTLAGRVAVADPSVADVVSALSGFERVPSNDVVRNWGPAGAATLIDVARDAARPPFVRGRALYALRLFPAVSAVHPFLRSTADDASLAPMLRHAAIDALAEGVGTVAEVSHYLSDPDVEVRNGTAWALSRLTAPEARAAIAAALRTETHPTVRATMQRALGQ